MQARVVLCALTSSLVIYERFVVLFALGVRILFSVMLFELFSLLFERFFVVPSLGVHLFLDIIELSL